MKQSMLLKRCRPPTARLACALLYSVAWCIYCGAKDAYDAASSSPPPHSSAMESNSPGGGAPACPGGNDAPREMLATTSRRSALPSPTSARPPPAATSPQPAARPMAEARSWATMRLNHAGTPVVGRVPGHMPGAVRSRHSHVDASLTCGAYSLGPVKEAHRCARTARAGTPVRARS